MEVDDHQHPGWIPYFLGADDASRRSQGVGGEQFPKNQGLTTIHPLSIDTLR